MQLRVGPRSARLAGREAPRRALASGLRTACKAKKQEGSGDFVTDMVSVLGPRSG
jgi:hypothetical protein